MSKNILILSGSPRRGGNSDILCDRFMEGARESGHRAEKVFLRDKNIGYCIGCEACHQNNGVCVQKDDMAEILGKMIAADVIVMATPLYYWNMSGQIRTAIDRLFALEEGDGNLLRGHDRACALLMSAEGHGFEDVTLYFDHLMEHLRWKNLGHVLAGGNGNVGDIKGKPEIQAAYDLGKSIG